MNKTVWICILFSLFMLSFVSSVNACSCAERPSVDVAFEQSDAVFSGKVKNIKEKKQKNGFWSKSVLFEVIQTWKGVENTQIIIATGLGGGDCGIDFIEGEEYLVYAFASTMYGNKTLEANICSRSNKLSLAEIDIKLLGEGKVPHNEVDLSKQQNRQLYFSHAFLTLSLIILVIGFGLLVRRFSRR